MKNRLFALSRPLLFLIPPEEAHELTLKSLERGVHPRDTTQDDPRLAMEVAGLQFPNPVAIAAGFDKDARVVDAVLALGCGYAEIGSLTPKSQSGNPKPRVFRLPHHDALINRLGFNNEGHAAALTRLAKPRRAGIVGVNIGANKDQTDRVADYVTGLDAFYDVASYIMVNISSPNTTGLRRLQDPASLEGLLTALMAARQVKIEQGQRRVPIFVKIAPDLDRDDIEQMCSRLVAHHVDAIAVSNTTLSRPGLNASAAREPGGLSGRPLFHRSTVALATVFKATKGSIPLIGIGGIDSGERAIAKIAAGASLLQLYTGLVYKGPGLIGDIKAALCREIEERGVAHLRDLVGRDADTWASKSLEG